MDLREIWSVTPGKKKKLFKRESSCRVLCKKFEFYKNRNLVDQLNNGRPTAMKIAIVLRSNIYLIS